MSTREGLHTRDVLLLDMGNTFMFGCDRFGDEENFEATYRAVCGRELDSARLRAALRETLVRMDRLYIDPGCYDAFPAVRDVVATCAATRGLSSDGVDAIAEVFARHEVGTIDGRYVCILEQLAQRWRLGVVSNVWAASTVFREAFERASILPLFEVVVFSSDYGCIKPSPKLFRRALDALGVVPENAWYVGDDLRCDVGGARAAGMKTIWINPRGTRTRPGDPVPQRIISDLGDLLREDILLPQSPHGSR